MPLRAALLTIAAAFVWTPPSSAQSSVLEPFPEDHDGSLVRACVLATASSGEPRRRVFIVGAETGGADRDGAAFVDRTVRLNYRLAVAGETVRQAGCSVDGERVGAVLAALRPDPSAPPLDPVPLDPTLFGSGSYPPAQRDVLECTADKGGARWCYVVETAAEAPVDRGVWAFPDDPSGTFEPVSPRPGYPLGTLVPFEPAGSVTPLVILNRRGDPNVLIRTSPELKGQ